MRFNLPSGGNVAYSGELSSRVSGSLLRELPQRARARRLYRYRRNLGEEKENSRGIAAGELPSGERNAGIVRVGAEESAEVPRKPSPTGTPAARLR